jgi:superfamily II DNA helicase RecQ
MHLCAQISWGGSFRPAFSQLSKLRDQLEPHTRLFGTTATLRPDTWKEIRETAGFRPETQPMRTSIYRSDVYLYMHPTEQCTNGSYNLLLSRAARMSDLYQK